MLIWLSLLYGEEVISTIPHVLRCRWYYFSLRSSYKIEWNYTWVITWVKFDLHVYHVGSTVHKIISRPCACLYDLEGLAP